MGPKKKKKLTKEEKAKLRAEELERIRKEEELERERLAIEAEEALEAATRKAEEDAKREVQEQIWRMEQLKYTDERVTECHSRVKDAEDAEKQQKQWEQYMKCDGLPDPASPPAMHTYLHLWRSDPKAERSIEPVIKKTGEVLHLLSEIDELIEGGGRLLPLWREVRQKLRCEQQHRLDEATYGLLRAASTMVATVDSTQVHYYKKADPFLTLSLQTELAPPLGQTAPSWNFEQLGVAIQLPPQYVGLHAACRSLWLRYDHYTDLCPSREPPHPPEHHNLDLQRIALELWHLRLEEKEREAEEKANAEAAAEEEKSQQKQLELTEAQNQIGAPDPGAAAPPAPAEPPPEEGPDEGQAEGEEGEEGDQEVEEVAEPVRDEEAERQKAEMEAMIKEMKPYELNLRKMVILGGVLHLDLIQQPPQPRELNKNLSLTVSASFSTRSYEMLIALNITYKRFLYRCMCLV